MQKRSSHAGLAACLAVFFASTLACSDLAQTPAPVEVSEPVAVPSEAPPPTPVPSAPTPAPAPQFKAIVAFVNQTPEDEEGPSEDWSFFLDDIRKAAGAHGIVVVESVSMDTAVPIPLDGGGSAAVDLTSFRQKAQIGYVFARTGSDPAFTDYGPSGDTLKAASAYFGEALTP